MEVCINKANLHHCVTDNSARVEGLSKTIDMNNEMRNRCNNYGIVEAESLMMSSFDAEVERKSVSQVHSEE